MNGAYEMLSPATERFFHLILLCFAWSKLIFLMPSRACEGSAAVETLSLDLVVRFCASQSRQVAALT